MFYLNVRRGNLSPASEASKEVANFLDEKIHTHPYISRKGSLRVMVASLIGEC